jgi:hypothetical protein
MSLEDSAVATSRLRLTLTLSPPTTILQLTTWERRHQLGSGSVERPLTDSCQQEQKNSQKTVT